VRSRLIGSAVLGIAVLVIGMLIVGTPEQPVVRGAAAAPLARDLSGVWMQRDLGDSFTKNPPPMQPWAIERTAANVKGGAADDPEEKCFPPGIPRLYLHRYPIEIIQSPTRTLVYYEYDHFVRQIWTDGRSHPSADELDPSWMGHSIGRWDGDAFVIDTVGFNDKTWLDNAGHPHSDALRLTERMRRADGDTLRIDFTFDDPKAYTQPWTGQKIFRLRPGWEIAEHVCADNFLWKEPGKEASDR
jgi:hypothetical protein